jgi:hypothetical protein
MVPVGKRNRDDYRMYPRGKNRCREPFIHERNVKWYGNMKV